MLVTEFGNISQCNQLVGFIPAGVIRALAGMSLGSLGFLFFKNLFNKRKSIFFLILSIIFISTLITFKQYISYVDLLFYVFSFMILLVTLHNLNIKAPSWIEKLGLFLGKISYPIFVFHYPVLVILNHYYPSQSYITMILYFILILLIIATIIIYSLRGLVYTKKNLFKKLDD